VLLILPEVHCKELNPADAAVNQHHRSKRFLLLKKLIHKMGEEFIAGSTATVPIETQQKPVATTSAAICSSPNYYPAASSPPMTAAPAYYPLAAETSTYYTTSTTSSPPITPSPYYGISKEQVAGPPPYSLSQNDYNAPLPLDQFRF